jgi:hypothetical protein
MADRSASVGRAGASAMQKNCRHCNAVIKLPKRSSAFYMGNCPQCKRTYAVRISAPTLGRPS